MMTLLDILKRTENFFEDKGIDTARLDAELLLSHVLKCDRMGLYLSFDKPLTETELQHIRPLVARRANREPIAYILGTKGFHAIDLIVESKTLCPRPDTEILVDAALNWITEERDIYVADLGCGTGAVGLAIAMAKPNVKVYATDLSSTAIHCTKANVDALGLGHRVGVLQGRWLDPIPLERPIDIVVSNPPYIPSADIETLQPEVRVHEPRLALDGGPDGLMHYREFIPTAANRARIGVLVEVGKGLAMDM